MKKQFKITRPDGKEMILWTDVQDSKIYIAPSEDGLNKTTQYWDYDNTKSIIDNVKSHAGNGVIVEEV